MLCTAQLSYTSELNMVMVETMKHFTKVQNKLEGETNGIYHFRFEEIDKI